MCSLVRTFKLSIRCRECTSSWFLHLVYFIQKLNLTIPNHISRAPGHRARDTGRERQRQQERKRKREKREGKKGGSKEVKMLQCYRQVLSVTHNTSSRDFNEETKRSPTQPPTHPTQHPPNRGGGSSPEEDLDSELLVGARGLVEDLNLGIKPEAPLIRCLHIVVDHHVHADLELVPPQEGPGAWPHMHRPHLHHAVLWVAEDRKRQREV